MDQFVRHYGMVNWGETALRRSLMAASYPAAVLKTRDTKPGFGGSFMRPEFRNPVYRAVYSCLIQALVD